MVRSLIFVSLLLNVALAAQVSQAQLFRGNSAAPAAREPARVGLLGGIREAREERFRREEQAAAAARTAAAKAAGAQQTPTRASATGSTATKPAAEAGSSASKTANTASNDALRRNATLNASSANSAQKADANSRTSNFRGPSGANSKINTGNSLSRATLANPAANVTQASASAFVPAPLEDQQYQGGKYQGPGVVIRLSKEARTPVNFLIDETTTSSIRPGEEQVLDDKGNYEVRYSRGVTRDGRSFGESRYKVFEGNYRFELTATGWELYREPDSDSSLAPPNPIDLVDNPVNPSVSAALLAPEPSSQSELQRLPANSSAGKLGSILDQPSSAPVRGESVKGTPSPAEPATKGPTSSPPAGNEEVLPAPKPRSILE
ncbi:MAG: hypothetical protein SFV81_03955 [Pirellulaceae bacterium]|nr:hypothetical protein [Pirellulaceae bacterium]